MCAVSRVYTLYHEICDNSCNINMPRVIETSCAEDFKGIPFTHICLNECVQNNSLTTKSISMNFTLIEDI